MGAEPAVILIVLVNWGPAEWGVSGRNDEGGGTGRRADPMRGAGEPAPKRGRTRARSKAASRSSALSEIPEPTQSSSAPSSERASGVGADTGVASLSSAPRRRV